MARPETAIAPRAPALVAVDQPAGRAVVARGDDDAVGGGDEHAADAALHAVGALGGERGEGHEVVVPAGAEAFRVEELEFAEVDVEGGEGVAGVEEADGGGGEVGGLAVDGVVELCV